MIFSLNDIPVMNLGASQRLNDIDVPMTGRIGVEASPTAPKKSPSAKCSIRGKLKGKALDFTETTNIRKAWTDKVVSNQNICVFDDSMMGDNDKLLQTPDKKGLPVIYGSNVTMDSPDPFSKYHEGLGPKVDSTSAVHGGFDPEFEMSTPVKSEGSIPLIYGSKVTMNSPDPFSKFHEGPGPKLDIAFMKDDLDISSSTLRDLVSGRKVVLNGGDKSKSKGQVISPQGIADLDDMDMLSTFNSSNTPVKGSDVIAACRTGGFSHVPIMTTIDPSLRGTTKTVKTQSNQFIPDEKCTISDIRRQLGSTSSTTTNTTGALGGISPSKPKRQLGDNTTVDSRQKASIPSVLQAAPVRRPLEPLNGNVLEQHPTQRVAVSQSTTSLQSLKQQQQQQQLVVQGVDGHSIAMQENVRPSTGYHVNSTRQSHHTFDPSSGNHILTIDPSGAKPIAKPPLKPSPPTAPAPASITGNAPATNFGRRNLMRDKDLEIQSNSSDGVVVGGGGTNNALPARPTSVSRRGRSYVESKDPLLNPDSAKSAPVATNSSSFMITNSARNASAATHDSAAVAGSVVEPSVKSISLEVVGDSCIINKSQQFGPVEQSIMVTGRPISAKAAIISPVKAFEKVQQSVYIPIESERIQLFPDDVAMIDRSDGFGECERECAVSLYTPSKSPRPNNAPFRPRRVQVTCVSSDPCASSRLQKRKKSSKRASYQPLFHLQQIPENEEVDLGVPSWLTFIGSFKADAGLQSLMKDMDSLFLDNHGSSSSSSQHQHVQQSGLGATLRKRIVKPIIKTKTIQECEKSTTDDISARVDRRSDTYSLWMSNQTICPASSDSEEANIFQAIRANDMDLIKENIESGLWNLTCTDSVGNAPLTVAVFCGIGRLVRYFIKAGAKLNSQNRFGSTALHFSGELEFEKVTNYLVKKGANTTLVNSMGLLYNQRM